jgi:hypothetical protein
VGTLFPRAARRSRYGYYNPLIFQVKFESTD